MNHQVYTDTSDTYFMADVTCRGNEAKLSECRQGTVVSISQLLCSKDVTDAGVGCTRKISIITHVISIVS